ncbi:MAG: arginine--tRNA ligase, partial [Pseudomonadota bacterium]
MNIFETVSTKVLEAVATAQDAGALPGELDLTGVEVQEPRDPAHGDVAVNAALVLAKRAGRKPRDIADVLASVLRQDGDIAAVEVAGPGFLNVRLADRIWVELIASVNAAGDAFGRSDAGEGRRVQVEYVSANPTGPMHIGHCRGAVYGDTLANLLAAVGYAVSREYYVNDAGAQVDKLGQSTFLRYREALGEEIGEIPEGLYPGDYLKPVGHALAAEHGRALLDADPQTQMTTARDAAIAAMLDEIKDDLGALGVKHDVFFSERSLTSDGR